MNWKFALYLHLKYYNHNKPMQISKTMSIIAAILALVLPACSEDNTPAPPAADPYIKIDDTLLADGITMPYTAGKKQISLQTNIDELDVASSNGEWCSASLTDNKFDDYRTIEIAALENNTGARREATVKIEGSGIARTIRVAQAAKPEEQPIKPEPPVQPAGEALKFAKSMGMGWNLGNQMDAYSNNVSSETVWGNRKATQALFDKLAETGISTVRIPVTWLGHIGEAPSYTIDASWLDRVQELVGYAEKAQLKAIINIHHDGADSKHWLNIKDAAKDPQLNSRIKEQITAMWTQIADRFKDKGDFLIFEAFNEIHDGKWGWGDNRTDGGKQYRTLNEWNQAFVDAVRAAGGGNASRYLGIPAYCTDPELAVNHLVMPTDVTPDRLLVSVHYYAPTEFSLEDKFSEWGHTGAAGKKATWGDEQHVKDIFGKLKTRFIDRGIPVYIGETGCVHRSTIRSESFRKYYLEYVCKAAREYGMPAIYWDNGSRNAGRECSGILDHGDGSYINNGKEILEAMVKAATSTDPGYTLDSVYDSAPR